MLSLQKKKFTLPAGSVYLNCSYMSPLLKEVEKAGINGIKTKRNPGELPPSGFFDGSEKLRLEFAKLINVKKPNRIAIIPSVSYGLATVSANLKIDRTQNIVVAVEQIPCNDYPWH